MRKRQEEEEKNRQALSAEALPADAAAQQRCVCVSVCQTALDCLIYFTVAKKL